VGRAVSGPRDSKVWGHGDSTAVRRRGVAGSDPTAAPVGGACTGGVRPALK
jgi:hypothetical protein